MSFVGDNIFFIAVTLWMFKLSGSATMLAVTLIAATAGQGLLALPAGALVDRIDRRRIIIAADICRTMLVAALPFVLPWAPVAGLGLLLLLNVGTVFFRTAIFALIPSVVSRDELPTATALFQTTQQIAQVIGNTLGGAIVIAVGFQMALYFDAMTFLVSAACVGLMPVAWRAGLGTVAPRKISTEVGEGLRYLWHTPVHRILALLILPGYLTLAFDALLAPMIVKTAGLSAVAYGVISSAGGVGKLVSSGLLVATGKRWVAVPFTVATFLLSSSAIIFFGSTTAYPALIAATFFFGMGNVATNISNATISMANTPSDIIGRLMASRQVIIAGTTIFGMLVFGRLADLAGPPIALIALGVISGAGVLIVWFSAGRQPRALAAAAGTPDHK